MRWAGSSVSPTPSRRRVCKRCRPRLSVTSVKPVLIGKAFEVDKSQAVGGSGLAGSAPRHRFPLEPPHRLRRLSRETSPAAAPRSSTSALCPRSEEVSDSRVGSAAPPYCTLPMVCPDRAQFRRPRGRKPDANVEHHLLGSHAQKRTQHAIVAQAVCAPH
jgi:hypothetical protein